MAYAIQWFCFATIVVIGVGILLWKTATTSRETVK
jgi:cytochrome oxidase assembly protein ShyY1